MFIALEKKRYMDIHKPSITFQIWEPEIRTSLAKGEKGRLLYVVASGGFHNFRHYFQYVCTELQMC